MGKKIIFTVSNDIVYDQRMMRICTSLSQAGFNCTIVGRKLPNSAQLSKQPYAQKRLKLWFTKGKLFYFELNIRLFFYLLFKNFNIVCSIDCDTALAALGASYFKPHSKLYFDMHELFAYTPEVVNRPRVQKIWLTVERWILNKCEVCYTVGQAIATEIEQTYGKKMEVIRNVPIHNPNYQKTMHKAPILQYQGALNEGRGLENAILATQQLPIVFQIIGEGDLSQKLRDMVKELKLENKVQFLGYIKPALLPTYTQQAWLGLNVSENLGKSYYLSLNNKFFDYMHAHLPSLINPFPEYVQINNEIEIGVITNCSVLDIVNNVTLLLNNKDKYNSMVNNCIKACDLYQWQLEEQKLIALYQI